MNYVIYENYPTTTFTLHKSSCKRYKKRTAQGTKNGNWCLFSSTKHQAYLRLWAIAKSISAAAKIKFCSACNGVFISYAIYANKPTNKVTLHRSSCRYYKKLCRPPIGTKNGKWFSVCGTRDEAIAEQKEIAENMQRAATRSKKKVIIRECKRCKP